LKTNFNNNDDSNDHREHNINDDLKKKILVVDDEKDVGLTFKDCLEDTNRFTVDFISDSQIVLENYKSDFYDLLLFDIRMPHLNGFELYNRLKKENKIKNEKICFITAYEIYYETLKKEYPKLDVGCFIRKPIAIEKLIKKVEAALSNI
jgi:two-component system, OmpR family, response regulator ChvI